MRACTCACMRWHCGLGCYGTYWHRCTMLLLSVHNVTVGLVTRSLSAYWYTMSLRVSVARALTCYRYTVSLWFWLLGHLLATVTQCRCGFGCYGTYWSPVHRVAVGFGCYGTYWSPVHHAMMGSVARALTCCRCTMPLWVGC